MSEGMNLFAGKKLSKLTFEQLTDELTSKQVAEGFFVDYKVDFPNDLPKYIASFANSYGGGYIFIGIDEDKVTKQPKSFPGITLGAVDYKEKVRNIARSNISPFPIMTIEAVPVTGSTDQAVLVIHVPESTSLPHIVSNGKVYTRNMDASEPCDPIKDRHSLDELYRRSEVRLAANKARLEKTITYSRVVEEKDWSAPKGPSGFIMSLIIYPAGGSLSYTREESKGMAMYMDWGGSWRMLPNGSALIGGGLSQHSKSDWWVTPRVGMCYTDGLLEHIIRREPAESLPAQEIASRVVQNARLYHGKLKSFGYVGPVVVEINLFGTWNVKIYDVYNRPSNSCDTGRITIKYDWEELLATCKYTDDEWIKQGDYLGKLIVADLMSHFGGWAD